MNLFLLEDDPKTAQFVTQGLEENGHRVRCVADGALALEEIAAHDFDVLILDRMTPSLDGLTVLQTARASGCHAPALLLTAMSQIEDRVAGLEKGADDYLVKPFAFVELLARITALGRRPPMTDTAPTLQVGDIEMNLMKRQVSRAGRPIELQPREFSLLEQLMRNPDRIVTRTMLLDRVWNFGFDPKTNIVETHMSRLRSKLSAAGASGFIRTIRGSGYILSDDGR